jgi:hypothetical protein
MSAQNIVVVYPNITDNLHIIADSELTRGHTPLLSAVSVTNELLNAKFVTWFTKIIHKFPASVAISTHSRS